MRLAAACILAAFIACFQSAAAIEIPDTATVLPGYASRIDASRRILDGATDNLTGLWNYPEEQWWWQSENRRNSTISLLP